MATFALVERGDKNYEDSSRRLRFGSGTRLDAAGGAHQVVRRAVGARAGQKLRLRGRGLPGPTPGDQYVSLKIVLPPDSPKAREFFERMKQDLPFDPRAGLGGTGSS